METSLGWPSELRAVFFDLDGTLIDREPVVGRAIVATCVAAGLDVDGGVVAASVGRAWPDVHEDLAVQSRLGWDIHEFVERVLGTASAMIEDGDEPAILAGGARLVRSLGEARVPVGLVTGSRRAEAEAALAVLGLVDAFDIVIASEDYHPGKPHPACYLLACERVGLDPAVHASACVVFEDSRPGVRAGRRAGMRVVATTAANAPEGHPARQDVSEAHAVVSGLDVVDATVITGVLV